MCKTIAYGYSLCCNTCQTIEAFSAGYLLLTLQAIPTFYQVSDVLSQAYYDTGKDLLYELA